MAEAEEKTLHIHGCSCAGTLKINKIICFMMIVLIYICQSFICSSIIIFFFQFLKSMGNAEAIAAVLKHCQKMSGFWAIIGSKSNKLLRVLIHCWSQGEDSCKVVAFLTIMKMANYNRSVFLLRSYKVSIFFIISWLPYYGI